MLKPTLYQLNAVARSYNGDFADSFLALRGGETPLSPPSTVPSRFDPLIEKFLPGYEQHPNFIAAVLLAFALAPLSKIYYEKLMPTIKNYIADVLRKGKGNGKREAPLFEVNFYRTKFYKTVETIVEAAQLFLLVAVFDVSLTAIMCLGVTPPKSEKLTNAFAMVAYLLWGFRRVSDFKYFVLKRTMQHTKLIHDEKRLFVINRLADYALVFFGIFALYEILNFETGYYAKSLLAVFSFGSAAIALATKDIIENFLNGVILSASDRIFVNDYVSIQGDIKKVNKLGWLETKLQGSDNILYTIPNKELLSTKLSNLSRIQTSQVSQTLKLPYSAIEKLPKLFRDIKAEIRMACPSIITDGSRPFQCYLVNYGKEVEVNVNAHFRIPPVGDAYYENRQECLLAMDRAIRRNEIEKYSGAGK